MVKYGTLMYPTNLIVYNSLSALKTKTMENSYSRISICYVGTYKIRANFACFIKRWEDWRSGKKISATKNHQSWVWLEGEETRNNRFWVLISLLLKEGYSRVMYNRVFQQKSSTFYYCYWALDLYTMYTECKELQEVKYRMICNCFPRMLLEVWWICFSMSCLNTPAYNDFNQNLTFDVVEGNMEWSSRSAVAYARSPETIPNLHEYFSMEGVSCYLPRPMGGNAILLSFDCCSLFPWGITLLELLLLKLNAQPSPSKSRKNRAWKLIPAVLIKGKLLRHGLENRTLPLQEEKLVW